MPRSNRSTRTPQVRKSARSRLAHSVEDRIARAHVRRVVEDTYRQAPERTYVGGVLTTVTFTDPSWQA
jgi:hypothetical protein